MSAYVSVSAYMPPGVCTSIENRPFSIESRHLSIEDHHFHNESYLFLHQISKQPWTSVPRGGRRLCQNRTSTQTSPSEASTALPSHAWWTSRCKSSNWPLPPPLTLHGVGVVPAYGSMHGHDAAPCDKTRVPR